MYLIDFIKKNPNWKELLSMPPYSLKIKEEDNYTLFMYSQLNSDFYNPIVKESRGIILDLSGKEPRVVCRGFDKFGNYGEGYVDSIDWSSAVVQEKVDGSIVKLWYDRAQWRISSNSTINAYKAVLDQSGISIGSLFKQAFEAAGARYEWFDPHYTYIFEIVSPYNRVVIDYGETALYMLGERNNETGEEVNVDCEWWSIFKHPQVYKLNSLEACIAAATALNTGEKVNYEGFVVVDKNFHRIKIKSPLYVAKHHVVTKNPSLLDLIRIYKNNEKEEFLTYFPLYKEDYEKIEYFFVDLATSLHEYKKIWLTNLDRKKFVEIAKGHRFFGYFMQAIDYNDWSITRVKNLDSEKLSRLIKNYLELKR